MVSCKSWSEPGGRQPFIRCDNVAPIKLIFVISECLTGAGVDLIMMIGSCVPKCDFHMHHYYWCKSTCNFYWCKNPTLFLLVHVQITFLFDNIHFKQPNITGL